MKHQTFLRADKDHDLTIGDCEYCVSRPGKFEREPRYVPLFWDRIMAWGDTPAESESDKAYRDYCDMIGVDSFDLSDDTMWGRFDRYAYDVTLEDVIDFPELATIKTVILWESESGFVYSDTRESDIPFYVFCGI